MNEYHYNGRGVSRLKASYDKDKSQNERQGLEFLLDISFTDFPEFQRACGVDGLAELIFPNYRNSGEITKDKSKLSSLMNKVGTQLYRWAITFGREQNSYRRGSQKLSERQIQGRSKRLVDSFLDNLGKIREKIKTHVVAAKKNDPNVGATAGYYPIINGHLGFRAIEAHEIENFFYESSYDRQKKKIIEPSFRLLAYYLNSNSKGVCNCEIDPGARIGSGFFVDHAFSSVIGETTEIGNNVTLYQGVTLGAYSFRKDEEGYVLRQEKRHPTLGNHVTAYTGATIYGGNVVIGDNNMIGAGSKILGGIGGVKTDSGVVMGSESLIQGGKGGVHFGKNSRLMDGGVVEGNTHLLTVGHHSLVGANILLDRSIGPYKRALRRENELKIEPYRR